MIGKRDGWMDGQIVETDGWVDGQIDRQMDRWLNTDDFQIDTYIQRSYIDNR